MTSIRELISDILDTNPADPIGRYFSTNPYDQRYSITAESQFKSKYVATHTDEDPSLGTYEKLFLSRIQDSSRSLIIFRGGTGSGKSSIVNRIIYLGQEIAKEKKRLNAFLKIDFISLSRFTSSERVTATENNINEFMLLIASQCEVTIADYLGNELSNFITHIDISEITPRPDLLTIIQNLKNNEGNIIATTKDLRAKINTLISSLNPSDRFLVSLEMLRYLGTWHHSNSDKFVIIFDNTDRIQRDFLKLFVAKVCDFDIDARFPSGMTKTVLFVRLSTANDTIAAIPRQYDIILSAKPIDAIINRMMEFLLAEPEYVAKYDAHTILVVKIRVCEFLFNILDGLSEFESVLSSISGSNIRTAFSVTRKWLNSNSLRCRTTSAGSVAIAIEGIVSELMGRRLDNAIGAISESLMAQLVNQENNQNHTWATKLCSRLFKIVRGNVDVVSSAPDRRMANALAAHWRSSLNVSPKQEYVRKIAIQIKWGLYRNKTLDSSEALSQIEMALLNTQNDKLTAEEIYAKKIIEEAVKLYKNLKSRRMLPSTEQKSRPGIIKFGIRKQPRFVQSALLLSARPLDGEPSFAAVNVLSVGNEYITIAPLLILFELARRQNNPDYMDSGIRYDNLGKILEERGIKRAEYIEAMKKLTDIDNRLIYSEVNDSTKIKEDGEYYTSENYFRLSWAGLLYCTKLIYTTTYLEWCLMSPRIIYDQLPFKRNIGQLSDAVQDNTFGNLEQGLENVIRASRIIIREMRDNNIRSADALHNLFFKNFCKFDKIVEIMKNNNKKDEWDVLQLELSDIIEREIMEL